MLRLARAWAGSKGRGVESSSCKFRTEYLLS